MIASFPTESHYSPLLHTLFLEVFGFYTAISAHRRRQKCIWEQSDGEAFCPQPSSRTSLRTGTVPLAFKLATVVPLYKTGDPSVGLDGFC